MLAFLRARFLLDQATQGKVLTYTMARMALLLLVLFTTIFLRQEVLGAETIGQLYAVIGVSFLYSLVTVTFWNQTMRVRYFLPSQLLYDLLLTSYLVYLTGVSDSIFLFLYLLNIVLGAVVYQLPGALLVAACSGGIYAFIYSANTEMGLGAWYELAWKQLLFFLAAVLCGQLLDELRRQKLLLESQRQDIARLQTFNDRLLNTIPVGILLVNDEGFVQKVNNAALELVRFGPDTPPSRYDELLPQLRGILGRWERMTETQRLRFLFSHAESVPPHLSLQIVKDTGDDEKTQHILVLQDKAKVLELEAKLEFESRLAATGELAAGIAHEIRNPLASISGCIELLAQHQSFGSEQDRRLMDISLRETRRLNGLITDFLEFAKPRDHTAEPVPLGEVADEVAEALRASAPDSFRFRIDVDRRVEVMANRERLKQVFFNLFLNAKEAAGENAVQIEVRATTGKDGVVIDVRDDGAGIPALAAERIFDPFFTTKTNGTGLGLPTVAQIIKAARGEIHLVPGTGGAHFRLRLPSSGRLEARAGD